MQEPSFEERVVTAFEDLEDRVLVLEGCNYALKFALNTLVMMIQRYGDAGAPVDVAIFRKALANLSDRFSTKPDADPKTARMFSAAQDCLSSLTNNNPPPTPPARFTVIPGGRAAD